MGAIKKVVKGLAMGAVLAGIASLVVTMRDEKNRRAAKELAGVAQKVKEKMTAHGRRLGKLSKSAYNTIVDTTIAEYRGVAALSEADLAELKKEMKGHWKEVKMIVSKRNECRRNKK